MVDWAISQSGCEQVVVSERKVVLSRLLRMLCVQVGPPSGVSASENSKKMLDQCLSWVD